MRLRQLCEHVSDAEPCTREHRDACLRLADFLGITIKTGQSGERVDDDFALIILRALEGRDEINTINHDNKLLPSAELKAKL